MRSSKKGTINIGLFPSLVPTFAMEVQKRFSNYFPESNVIFHEISKASILTEMCGNGQLDMAIYDVIPKKNEDWIFLFKDPYLAIFPKDDPRSKAAYFPITEFGKTRFIATKEGFSASVKKAFKEADLSIDISYSTIYNDIQIAMVSKGFGISAIPETLAIEYFDKIDAIPIAPAVTRDLGIYVSFLKKRSFSTKKIIKCICETAEEYIKTREPRP